MAVDIKNLLSLMVQKEISDIHFKADSVPALRVHGSMILATNLQKMSAEEVKGIAYQLMTKEQAAEFERDMELDLAYSLEGLARFRVNVYRQKGTIGLTLRVVPVKLRTFEELNLPVEPMTKLGAESRGLILFAGITGAGKTTTLNSFLHHINTNHQHRIITIEDPIEFFHSDVKSTIVQREVGFDTKSFGSALKHILRQDPDVVVVGEMRDLETIQLAISAAETGHLCFATLHTQDAATTVDRIIDVFPSHQQQQVRVQLSTVLQAVVCQQLLPRKGGGGQVCAREFMRVTSGIANLIREAKTHQIYGAVEAGAKHGMITMDQYLAFLLKQNLLEVDEALGAAHEPETVKRLAGMDVAPHSGTNV